MIVLADSTHTSDTTVALIALAGAVVGGLLTGASQLLAEKMKARRDAREAQAVARGIGRVINLYFLDWQALVDIGLEHQDWWEANREPASEWGRADLQRVASALEANDWTTVSLALVSARNLSIIRSGITQAEQRLSPDDVKTMRESLRETFGAERPKLTFLRDQIRDGIRVLNRQFEA